MLSTGINFSTVFDIIRLLLLIPSCLEPELSYRNIFIKFLKRHHFLNDWQGNDFFSISSIESLAVSVIDCFFSSCLNMIGKSNYLGPFPPPHHHFKCGHLARRRQTVVAYTASTYFSGGEWKSGFGNTLWNCAIRRTGHRFDIKARLLQVHQS